MDEIDPSALSKLLAFDPATGGLTWLPRPVEMFRSPGDAGRWHSNFCGKAALTATNDCGYRIGAILGRNYRAHRVIWALAYGKWPDGQIDHINGDRSDNRLVNLREVSASGNQRNARMPRTNTSGVAGVYWWPERRKWRADIKVDGKSKHLGLFDTKQEAAKAREDAKAKYGYTARHGLAA